MNNIVNVLRGHDSHFYPHFLSDTNISVAVNPTLYFDKKSLLIKNSVFSFM